MHFPETGLYHIYNRGNNKQKIFFNDCNYEYFLAKCVKNLKPVTEVLAWCLMFNHFHFLVEATTKSTELIHTGSLTMSALANGFRIIQSSYAKGINNQENRTGNLFQQKTKAKLIGDNIDYARNTFFYIHQNPVAAGIVTKAEDWSYSSWRDYLGTRKNSFCNIDRCKELLHLNEIDLSTGIEKNFTDEDLKWIY